MGASLSPMVDQTLLQKIDSLALSERLSRLRERYFDETLVACSERLQLVIKAWKETEGQHIELRKAKSLKKVLAGLPVVIHEGELTAGSTTKHFRGAYPYIDWDAEYFKHPEVLLKGQQERQVTFGSPGLRGVISYQDLQACDEAMAYFKGKTPAELSRQALKTLWGSWYEDAMVVRAGASRYESWSYGSGVLMFEKVLEKGLRGIIQEVEDRIQRFIETEEDDPEKLYFWQALLIACEAVVQFARRHVQLARELARREEKAAGREELEEIARTCEWVPENPARTFREAIQAIRLIHAAAVVEGGRGAPCLGRLDQYLHPYFKRDIEEERLTLEEAAELIGDLISYLARMEWISEISMKEFVQVTTITHITLGGVNGKGEDATNELTYLILHMLGLLRYAEPHATLRWHPDTPRRLLLKGLQTSCKVAGTPMFVNSEHVTDYFQKRGVSLEAARDWSMNGCSQAVADPQKHHKTWHINVPLALDLALHNGVSSITGKRIGPETGDPRTFQSFDEVYAAFQKQYEFIVRRLARAQRLIHRIETMCWRMPLHSALLYGCIENGKSHLAGGNGAYPIWYMKDRGIIDTADSLTATKKLVFEEKKLTMGDLVDALDSNFAGEKGERIRQACLTAPKYGNDLDEADYMVRDMARFTGGVILSEKNPFGWPFAVNRNGLSWHYHAAKGVGALPSGRKAGEPLNDGSLSPMRGMDTRGPTAVLNSVLKANFKEQAATAILNQKFPLTYFQSPESLEKVASLTETFLDNGGLHIQYNFLDRQLLLEAKKYPEKYKDLVVRVAGYSAYFVTLSPEIQDDIIRRTEQSL